MFHWRFQQDRYLLPEDGEQATMMARVLNQLIDAPYRYQEYDCNGFSLQLLSLLLRSGVDAGIISNGDHMWVVMVAADGRVVEWEPITNQEVAESDRASYTTNDGLVLY